VDGLPPSHYRKMRLRSLTVRVSSLAVVALLCLAEPGLAMAQAERAGAPSQLRAMVWLTPETYEVLERIRGQTNDLSANLLVDSRESIPSDMNAQLQTAYALGSRQDVSLVIWFVKQPDAERRFTVHILIPKTQRMLTRDLDPGDADSGGAGLSSVVKESAALVVRAAIQAVLSGSTIGEVARFDELAELPSSEAEAPPGIENDTARKAVADTSARAQAATKTGEPSSSRVGRPWALGLEWLLPNDGVGSGFAECSLLRLERRMQPLEAFVAGSGCLPRKVESHEGVVRIWRQQAVIGANYILRQTGFEASLGAQAGVVFYERETLKMWNGTINTSTLHALGSAGPEFRLLAPAHGSRVQAGFVLGVDFLAYSMSIVYADIVNRPVTRTYAVQPYAAFGLTLRL
jgi:hypothetical protein